MKHKCFITLILLIGILFTLTACNYSDMPFNGDITFNSISLTIPEKYIRDSTESNDDLWVFEHGFYKEYILLVRQSFNGAPQDVIDSYCGYLLDRGALAETTVFNDCPAVQASYTIDGMFAQELFFAHDGVFYSIALRGGTEADFLALINSIRLAA